MCLIFFTQMVQTDTLMVVNECMYLFYLYVFIYFLISDVLPSEGLACYQARTSHGVAGL